MQKTLSERFWGNILCDIATGCWLWTGPTAQGYGKVFVTTTDDGPLNFSAHRLSVLLSGRLIPPGLVVDHLCTVKLCVRPDHLEVVTPSENSLRSRKQRLAGHAESAI